MEVAMKAYNPKHLVTLFITAVAVAFAGPAAARGDHDGLHHASWHGARATLTWTVAGSTDTYSVDTPMNPPLRFVKMNFMAETGMKANRAEDFVVEKKVVTTTTGPAVPPGPLPPGALPSARDTATSTTTTTVTYQLLDDSKSLADQGIADGDTLRIRQVPGGASTDSHDGRHFGWGEGHHRR
jgi:hypothetical protein